MEFWHIKLIVCDIYLEKKKRLSGSDVSVSGLPWETNLILTFLELGPQVKGVDWSFTRGRS